MGIHKFVGASAIAIAAITISTAASAQTAEDAERVLISATDEDAILVQGQRSYYDDTSSTAARVELPILETPQSVFVINSELIADQQAFRLDQVLQNDSSVQKANNFLGAYSSYQIRGFLLSNSTNYLRSGRSFFHLASPPVEVLERVEVLKGPSSVLYGALAPGGIINMVPKSPTDFAQTSVKATVGSFDLYHFHVDHGGPLTSDGSIRYRVNAVYEDSGSYRVFADGTDFETQRLVLSAALEWDISSRTSFVLNGDFTEDNRPQDIGLINLTGDFSRQDYNLIISQPWSRYDSDVWNVFGEVTHEFTDNIKLRAGASFQSFMRDRYDNQVRGLPNSAGDIGIRARRRINRSDYTTLYADLISEFQTGAVEHQLLVGVDRTDVGNDNNETARNFNFVTNIFDPQVIPDPMIVTRPEKDLGFEDRFGITVHDVISIGDHWRLMLGARYDRFDAAQSSPDGTVVFAQEAENITPRVGLVYLPAPSLSLYASYSQNFEPNSPVGPEFDNAGEILDPTIGEQIEVGVKWEALGGKLLTTGALFTIDRKDAPFADPATNTVVQRGLQRHKGGELSIVGLVNDNITLSGSATYLDAEFIETDDPSLIGNTPAGVPEFALSLTGEYEIIEGPLRGLAFQGGVFYESDREVDDANTFRLEAYTRIDAGIKYVQDRGEGRARFVYRLTAQNLTDIEYFKGSSPLAINPERPREIRASIEVLF
jgi:iron complex outermembrane receptor protein